jgi:hypothetical protein
LEDVAIDALGIIGAAGGVIATAVSAGAVIHAKSAAAAAHRSALGDDLARHQACTPNSSYGCGTVTPAGGPPSWF